MSSTLIEQLSAIIDTGDGIQQFRNAALLVPAGIPLADPQLPHCLAPVAARPTTIVDARPNMVLKRLVQAGMNPPC